MKVILSFLFLFAALKADEVSTQLKSPFHLLQVDSRWRLEENEEQLVVFADEEDEDTDFIVAQGRLLSKKLTAQDLFKECQKAKGKVSRVSSLMKSFPVLDEEGLFDTPSQIQVCGMQAVKVYNHNSIQHTIEYSSGEVEHREIKLRGVIYLIPVGNRIYLLGVETPVDRFAGLMSHLEETVLPGLLKGSHS